MSPQQILEELYIKAVKETKSNAKKKFHKIITVNVDILIDNIDKNKSLLSALVTSLLKKIINPEQDVRLHRKDFPKGYSARSLDAAITAPFFKQHFPKYANKESSFLTLATREKIKWTKTVGKNLKIRNKDVKKSFLELFDAIESNKINPKDSLIYIFIKLQLLSLQHKMVFDETIESADFLNIININSVLKMLERHFEMKLSSRLPVIAIYSIYQQLFKEIRRYDGKKLKPLNVHTSADRHGYGDIEILNSDDTPFEMVEIKHNISIDRNLIFDVTKKSEDTSIKRYYILTTAKENFSSVEEEEFINKFILKIKKDTGIEIIANGIYFSLKYYLRFINDYKEFIINYTQNLIMDSKNSTEIKEFHIKKWQDILKEHKIDT